MIDRRGFLKSSAILPISVMLPTTLDAAPQTQGTGRSRFEIKNNEYRRYTTDGVLVVRMGVW